MESLPTLYDQASRFFLTKEQAAAEAQSQAPQASAHEPCLEAFPHIDGGQLQLVIVYYMYF